jgi:NADH-quinone oxidoreductase subunit N
MDLVNQFGSMVRVNLASIGSFVPELVLTFGTLALFLLDAVVRKSAQRRSIMTVGALLVLGVAAFTLAGQPVTSAKVLFNGMVATDAFGTFFKWLFLAAGVVTVSLAAPGKDFPSNRIGQFYALLMAVIVGLFLMATASDLLMMYMAIELVSMVSYVLAGFRKGDRRASEGSLKYVIYGGVASGVMLFGMSYVFGLTRTTDIYRIAAQIQGLGLGTSAATKLALVVAIVFVTAGVGYKIAAVPWHMWCPDVYEGAPTIFTAFLSVGPKAAGFALAIRLFYTAFATTFPGEAFSRAVAGVPWPAIVGIIAAVTMTLGNLTALAQTNVKRLLAYSSIAHAGYMLMGVAALSDMGKQSVMLYMLIYLVMNLGAFLVVILVAEATGSESMLDYRGLSKRHPLAAIALSIFLFSLTGLPPFAGFAGKWYLFYAIFERIPGPGGFWYTVLALIAALNTAVALFYYVRIIRAMYIDQPFAEPTPIKAPLFYQVVLASFSVAVMVFGVWWTPMIDWTRASLRLLGG